jgi:transposase-like protein
VSYLTGEPPTSRKSTQEQKDEFFAVFDRLKSTREAARELGLNPDTCAGWVRRAGLKSHGKPGARPHRGREEYSRLRDTDLSRREAATAVGVHLKTAADGRVVGYKSGVTTMTSPAAAPGRAPAPPHVGVGARKTPRPPVPQHAGAGDDPGPEGRRFLPSGPSLAICLMGRTVKPPPSAHRPEPPNSLPNRTCATT